MIDSKHGGGEGGIRTHGGLPLDGFQDRSIRPLWHLPKENVILPLAWRKREDPRKPQMLRREANSLLD